MDSFEGMTYLKGENIYSLTRSGLYLEGIAGSNFTSGLPNIGYILGHLSPANLLDDRVSSLLIHA